MGKFCFKVSIFISLILLSVLYVFYQADGTTDASYLKFTTPQKKSLIIGSSRAAQGIQPKVLKDVLGLELYNYAFQIVSSPFGEAYFNSITKKVKKNGEKGVFILEVNPWTISSTIDKTSGKETFPEEQTFLKKVTHVNCNPNLDYLINCYHQPFISILRNKKRKGDYQTFCVEDDGWLRVTIESDFISKEKRTNNKIKTYKDYLKTYKRLSNYRIDYLAKTIKYLKQHGKVVLVRMPVHKLMLDVENELLPNFNILMNDMSEKLEVPYINMTKNIHIYNYTDGNHLDIESGEKFSRDLANNILNVFK